MTRQPDDHCREIPPIVDTQWLSANNSQEKLTVIDIRSSLDYADGHIPGAVNAPFEFPESAWITVRNGLYLEVPDTDELFETLGGLGIQADSWVVIVGAPNPGDPAPHYGLANGTRAADTLIYAGVANVAVLDGGYPKWVAEGRKISTQAFNPTAIEFDGVIDTSMFVSVDYVHQNKDSDSIIDARDADVYFGAALEPWTDKAGHIPGAASLPAPWIWTLNDDGTYTFKKRQTLAAMAAGALGKNRGCRKSHNDNVSRIIVYCGIGGYASSWWFVLTQVLNYKDVKFFDGASQEWAMYYDMVPYRWE